MKSPNVTISSSFIKEIKDLHDNKSTTPRHKSKNSIIKTSTNSAASGIGMSTNNTYNSAINATQSTFTSSNASNMFSKPKNSLFNLDKDKGGINDSRASLKDKYKEKTNVSGVSSANNSDKNNKSSNSGHSVKNEKGKTNNNLQSLTNISKTPRSKDLVSNLIDADIQQFKSG